MRKSIEKLRVEYGDKPLLEESLDSNPIEQFSSWLMQAIESKVYEPNAMTLSTISEDGRPSGRTVLLKGFGPSGFLFFTDYSSRKSHQLKGHPFAAVTFWWKEIYRQVTIEGRVKKVPRSQTVAYFAKRPRGAQIAAVASSQSAPLSSRLELEEIVKQVKKKYAGKPIPCPASWGGYLVVPERIEFWQGHANRLHDRFLYVLTEGEWFLARLFP